MNLQERIESYVERTDYPRSLFVSDDQRIVGTWIMGQNYKVASGLYGGYPHGYLKRVKALFPDKKMVLHLFSGKVDLVEMSGHTVDINAQHSPTYVDDAQTLKKVPVEHYDLILADPPYSVEDADRYQTTMIKRNVVMQVLGERAKVGTHIVWLDQVLPMTRKDRLELVACIGCVKSSNHRFRVVSIFERRDGPKSDNVKRAEIRAASQ